MASIYFSRLPSSYRNPVANPYQIVGLSLERAQKRIGLPALHFRPLLQVFGNYTFDRGPTAGPAAARPDRGRRGARQPRLDALEPRQRLPREDVR